MSDRPRSLVDDDGHLIRCAKCSSLIYSGEPRYTAGEPERYKHYRCHEEDLQAWEESKRRLPDLMAETESIIRRLKERLS